MSIITNNSNKVSVKGNTLNTITPPQGGWFQINLTDDIIKYLWKICDKAKVKKESAKNTLVGNISQSYNLIDENDYFLNELLEPLCKIYLETSPLKIFQPTCITVEDQIGSLTIVPRFQLNSFWVNYQYQTEFNPPHNHSGLFSFVIWLKIPYDYKEQSKLPQFEGTKPEDIKAGNFEFHFLDLFGTKTQCPYPLDKSWEGVMLLFPSHLEHQVYPFYNCDEERVSISGNIFIDPFANKNKVQNDKSEWNSESRYITKNFTKDRPLDDDNDTDFSGKDTPQKLNKQRFTFDDD